MLVAEQDAAFLTGNHDITPKPYEDYTASLLKLQALRVDSRTTFLWSICMPSGGRLLEPHLRPLARDGLVHKVFFPFHLVGLFAIIWAESKSLHNRLISFFSGCAHFAIQRLGVESA